MLPFIPAWLDEAGLTPVQSRVLIHLWRRADRKTGRCWPGADSIAEKCKIHRDSVWPALKELERRGLLRRQRRTGTSNEFFLFPPGDATGNGGPTGTEGPTQSLETDGPRSLEWDGPRSQESDGRGMQETEGRKGIPIKETQRKNPSEGEAPPHTGFSPLVLSEEERDDICGEFFIDSDAVYAALKVFNRRKATYPTDPRTAEAFTGWLETSTYGKGFLRAESAACRQGQKNAPPPPSRAPSGPSSPDPESDGPPDWKRFVAESFSGFETAGKEWRDLADIHRRTIQAKYDSEVSIGIFVPKAGAASGHAA